MKRYFSNNKTILGYFNGGYMVGTCIGFHEYTGAIFEYEQIGFPHLVTKYHPNGQVHWKGYMNKGECILYDSSGNVQSHIYNIGELDWIELDGVILTQEEKFLLKLEHGGEWI